MSVNNTYKNNILIICNVINVTYHLPQIVKTYRTKSVKDFDSWYLFLGNLHSICWVLYGIEDRNSLMIFNSCVSIFTISFVGYYKLHSFIIEWYKLKNKNITIVKELNNQDNIITVTCEEPSK